ncbi:hypothetical protein RD792_004433 [Penstemon davidsonii]|uniref:Chromo domain-containing protein n=1 Tax=Penstemon davidsonii TaxID=160366 RepID=A0ABR0DHG6_9LAMI|nr:hypothetical protein RD792_004433 [Penstemon davidsonii]
MYWYVSERRGWSEEANTWEPVENLLQCSDIIDAFEESLKAGKSRLKRKRKRKNNVTHVQSKKKQQHQHQLPPAAAINNLPSRVVRIVENPIPVPRLNDCANENGETHASGVNSFETFKKVNESEFSVRREEEKEQNELDLKICELKGAMAMSMEDADMVDVSYQEGQLTEGDALRTRLLKIDAVDPVQSGRCTGAKKRKSGSVKRFKKDPDSCSVDDAYIAVPSCTPMVVQHPDSKSIPTITQIVKPISYKASISNNVQEVLVVFEAVRFVTHFIFF